MVKILKQILIILILSIIVGFVVNAINPKGVPLVMEIKDIKEKSDTLKVNFVNDPYDTTQNNTSLMQNPNLNKQGFVEPQNIKLNLAKQLFDRKALFIDGRLPQDYSTGRIKGAINIPYEEFHKKTKEERAEMMKGYNKHGIIVCYCLGGDCEMSIDLAYDIAKLGFTSVNIYSEGYKVWENAGYPVEK
ncbi:MAG: rhodanese-like domain-containing protein [Ignavibacteria bacterium]|jgi:3-mercaptopyruvate sulfurtransferase SseA